MQINFKLYFNNSSRFFRKYFLVGCVIARLFFRKKFFYEDYQVLKVFGE